jgi:DNA polymerase-4
MGRGDGTGRLISPPGADDTGAGILHVDMDAFYASVEVLDDPALRGKPVIIGAPESRSVVSSASYEARRFGVRSAMPVGQALRLCPIAIVVPPRFPRYVEISRRVMDLFREITPLVEPLSIDEAFLDVRGVRRLWGSPGIVAQLLRTRVQAELGLSCSVGAAATKHVAKMASTISKPDGLLIVPEAATWDFLGARNVRELWGVGPKAAEALAARGIRTVADVRDTPDHVLDRVLGAAMGLRVRELSRGIDVREVETVRTEKSIGHEETFHEDIVDDAALHAELRRLADRVGARLRSGGWEAATVSIKVRFSDFTRLTRAQTLAEPTAVGHRIGSAAIDLFTRLERHLPVRLVGVRAEKLRSTDATATALWDDDEDWKRVEGVLDGAAAKFGRGSITRAVLLGPARGGSALPSHPRPAEDGRADG